MFETMYELLFYPGSQSSYQAFTQNHGYEYAGALLLSVNGILAAWFYFLLGNTTTKYAKASKWLLFLMVADLITFISTVFVVGFIAFQAQSVSEFLPEVWLFAGLYNGLIYGSITFLVLSMVFKYGSKHARYTPF